MNVHPIIAQTADLLLAGVISCAHAYARVQNVPPPSAGWRCLFTCSTRYAPGELVSREICDDGLVGGYCFAVDVTSERVLFQIGDSEAEGYLDYTDRASASEQERWITLATGGISLSSSTALRTMLAGHAPYYSLLRETGKRIALASPPTAAAAPPQQDGEAEPKETEDKTAARLAAYFLHACGCIGNSAGGIVRVDYSAAGLNNNQLSDRKESFEFLLNQLVRNGGAHAESLELLDKSCGIDPANTTLRIERAVAAAAAARPGGPDQLLQEEQDPPAAAADQVEVDEIPISRTPEQNKTCCRVLFTNSREQVLEVMRKYALLDDMELYRRFGESYCKTNSSVFLTLQDSAGVGGAGPEKYALLLDAQQLKWPSLRSEPSERSESDCLVPQRLSSSMWGGQLVKPRPKSKIERKRRMLEERFEREGGMSELEQIIKRSRLEETRPEDVVAACRHRLEKNDRTVQAKYYDNLLVEAYPGCMLDTLNRLLREEILDRKCTQWLNYTN